MSTDQINNLKFKKSYKNLTSLDNVDVIDDLLL